MRLVLSIVALTFALTMPAHPAVSGEATPSPLVLILDASGSMWGQIAGEAKIVGARRVITTLGDQLADGTPLALVAYGHRREGDCNDIETLLPLAAVDRPMLATSVANLAPKGKTPITGALEHAWRSAPPGATIVLVTDGLETCAADPCAAVRNARTKGLDFVLHVIGFDVAKEDVSSLECAAQSGGGLYLPAADAAALGRALELAVERPADTPAGALVVRTTRNGALQDVAIRIRGTAGAVELAARTYASSETNPRTIPLADGTYRLSVQPVGIAGADAIEEEIVVRDGGRLERNYDFSTGTVEIGVTRNGALSDVTWQLFRPGDRKRAVATGRTYRDAGSNPARATVPSGDYELVLTAIEIGGKPTVELGPLTVDAAETARRTHDMRSGELAVRVVRGATLVDATVAVRRAGQAIDHGRTYTATSSNPRRFTLEPGSYEVEVTEIRGSKRVVRVELEAGDEAAITIDFATATP